MCVWRIENWWRLKKTFNAEMVKMYFHDNSFLDCEVQSCFKGKESSNCLFSTFCKFCLKKFAPTSFSTMRWKMKTFKAVFDKKYQILIWNGWASAVSEIKFIVFGIIFTFYFYFLVKICWSIDRYFSYKSLREYSEMLKTFHW